MMDFIKQYQKVPVNEYHNKITVHPLVSVCVQTYQHVNFIAQCLDGILMQKTEFVFEILLGEDASTDGTREVCIDYAKKYSSKIRLFLHSRENNISINGHPTGRFNFLYNLSKTRGKYIALCEGDDYWTDPYKLQKQVDFLENKKEYNGCAHQISVIYENNQKLIHPFRINEASTFYINDLIIGRRFHTASLLFRAEIYKMNIFPTNILSGDKALIFLIASYGPIYFFNDDMGVYRKHDSGISHNTDMRLYKYDLNIVPWILKINPKFPVMKFKSHLYRTMARSVGNTRKTLLEYSIKYFVFSFSYFPFNILEMLRYGFRCKQKN